MPEDTRDKVMVISVQAYLGRSQSVVPFASSHSVEIIQKDDFFVEFFPEMSDDIVKDLPNQIYFEVKSSDG